MNREIKDNFEKIKEIWRSKKFDPNGSYTGNEINNNRPVQDQDDLWRF